jgi:hypothetical protein
MNFVQFSSLRDLIMLSASSPTSKVIQHLKVGDKHLYFILAGTFTQLFLYMVKLEEAIEGSFITYNSYTGEISSSEKLVSEPSIESFPIVEIVKQDLLPPELLERVGKL